MLSTVDYNVLYPSRSMQGYGSVHGGKKNEEANALGNARDTEYRKLKSRSTTSQPVPVLIGKKPNS
jgi:hypothetical protein